MYAQGTCASKHSSCWYDEMKQSVQGVHINLGFYYSQPIVTSCIIIAAFTNLTAIGRVDPHQ